MSAWTEAVLAIAALLCGIGAAGLVVLLIVVAASGALS